MGAESSVLQALQKRHAVTGSAEVCITSGRFDGQVVGTYMLKKDPPTHAETPILERRLLFGLRLLLMIKLPMLSFRSVGMGVRLEWYCDKEYWQSAA